MPDPLPAAHAVWHAYETANCDPYLIDPRRAGVVAALRAAAEQVKHEFPLGPEYTEWDSGHDAGIRRALNKFLAIATELEQL
jgi:hypothetical protein